MRRTKREKMKPYNVLFATSAWLTVLAAGVPMSGWYKLGTLIVCLLCLMHAANRDYEEKFDEWGYRRR